jgi:hypothetical protein
MTPEANAPSTPAAKVVVEYRPKPTCKRCGGRGIDGYRTTQVRQPDGTATWQRGDPIRCACCREVRREVTAAPALGPSAPAAE